MKKANSQNLDVYSQEGVCQMGAEYVPYYRTAGNRLWMDRKAIELVLTGKNQHNLLGQYKDPKNHNRIYDKDRGEAVDVITPKGVSNYLDKARSVSDERRHDYYFGVKNIGKKKSEITTEPLQKSIFNSEIHVKTNDFIRIEKDSNGEYDIEFYLSDDSQEDKNQRLIKMLLNVSNAIMNGNAIVKSM